MLLSTLPLRLVLPKCVTNSHLRQSGTLARAPVLVLKELVHLFAFRDWSPTAGTFGPHPLRRCSSTIDARCARPVHWPKRSNMSFSFGNFDLTSGLSSLTDLGEKLNAVASSLESSLRDDRFGIAKSQANSGAATPRTTGRWRS